MEKATLGFHIYKIWQILKPFDGTFHQAQTPKLRGVVLQLHIEQNITEILTNVDERCTFAPQP